MGCCFSKHKMEIEIIDTISKDPEFDYLRPKGRLILKMNSVSDVPKIDILFDDWYSNSIRLWPKTNKACKHFLRIERTPPCCPLTDSDSGNDNLSLDTIH